jgi:hypothetical protein
MLEESARFRFYSAYQTVVSDTGANEIFHSALNNAVLFKAVVCVVGLSCIFMGYRLLMGRSGGGGSAEHRDEQTRRPKSSERSVPGLVLGLFGMAVIAFGLFRNTPVTVQEKSAAQEKDSLQSSKEISPITRNSAAPVAPRPKDVEFSTKVREVTDRAGALPWAENDKREVTAGDSPVIRGATGVQTKGGYVPFARPRFTETNRTPTQGASLSNGGPTKTFVALSNKTGLGSVETNRPLRAPFKLRISNP